MLLAIMLAASTAAVAQASGPKAVVMAFYKYDATHSQVFDRENIDARKRWFHDGLYKLFLKELDRKTERILTGAGSILACPAHANT